MQYVKESQFNCKEKKKKEITNFQYNFLEISFKNILSNKSRARTYHNIIKLFFLRLVIIMILLECYVSQ